MTRNEARAFDAWAINTIGVPGVVLMENAGRSCADLIKEKLQNVSNPEVCIFCGTGNNGGDGYVIARHLINSGYGVKIAIFGNQGKIKGDAKTNPDISEQIKEFVLDADLIVDGILGTGLSGKVKEDYKKIIAAINGLECPVLAVDIPSGLDCDTGRPLDTAVKADYTVTFGALKKGFTEPQAAQYTGEIYIASIGVNPG